MGSLFGGARTPAVTPAPPLPQRDDPSIAEAARRTKRAAAQRRGRRSTILTSGKGVTETATVDRPEATGKTVLG